jgi:arylsulfatase A-like enzyme
LIARGPGGFAGGRHVAELASNVDLYPTILELCGLRPPADCDGVSRLPLVDGSERQARRELFAELTYHTTYDPMRCIRTERHKYVRSFADRPLFLPAHVDASPSKDLLRDQGYFEPRRPAEMLFDRAHDPLERTNLAGDPAHATTREMLRSRLERRMRATDDPLLEGDVPAPPGTAIRSADVYDPADGLPPIM